MTTVKQQILKEKLEDRITKTLIKEATGRLQLNFRDIMQILNNCKNTIIETKIIKY
jgi:hypothetical protein